jgi:hypothetical protein
MSSTSCVFSPTKPSSPSHAFRGDRRTVVERTNADADKMARGFRCRGGQALDEIRSGNLTGLRSGSVCLALSLLAPIVLTAANVSAFMTTVFSTSCTAMKGA